MLGLASGLRDLGLSATFFWCNLWSLLVLVLRLPLPLIFVTVCLEFKSLCSFSSNSLVFEVCCSERFVLFYVCMKAKASCVVNAVLTSLRRGF